MSDSDVAAQAESMLQDWRRASRDLDRAKAALDDAQTTANAAAIALATFLLPADAKAGEQIGVWHGKNLITVALGVDGQATVSVRKRAGP